MPAAMPRVRIIYDVDGWAYHRRALMLERHAPAGFEFSLAAMAGVTDPHALVGDEPFDLLLLMARRDTAPIGEVIAARGWSARLVVNWSVGWPHHRESLLAAYRSADAVILTNRGYWEALGRLPRTCFISNGVDFGCFGLRSPLRDRAPRVLWTGSFHHRRRKGYDRFVLPLARALRARGIDCDLLLVDSDRGGSLTQDQMARWYNTGTVLVCASDTEGTPNPALEAAACGCTVVSTPVGNMPELIRHGENGYLVERSLPAMVQAVIDACERHLPLAERMQIDIATWDWASRIAAYFEVFGRVLAAPSRSATLALNER